MADAPWRDSRSFDELSRDVYERHVVERADESHHRDTRKRAAKPPRERVKACGDALARVKSRAVALHWGLMAAVTACVVVGAALVAMLAGLGGALLHTSTSTLEFDNAGVGEPLSSWGLGLDERREGDVRLWLLVYADDAPVVELCDATGDIVRAETLADRGDGTWTLDATLPWETLREAETLSLVGYADGDMARAYAERRVRMLESHDGDT